MGLMDFLSGTSKLHRATKKGDHEIVRQLLSNGFDVSLCDRNGTTPLHLAVHHGHYDW